MRLVIPPEIQDKLRQIRQLQLDRGYRDHVFEQQEVVILTLGLGPAMYLAIDGRMIEWDIEGMWSDNDKPFEVDDEKAIVAGIVIGALRLPLPELWSLLPPMPANGTVCPRCAGEHVLYLQPSPDGKNMTFDKTKSNPDKWLICPDCSGRAWTVPDQAASDLAT